MWDSRSRAAWLGERAGDERVVVEDGVHEEDVGVGEEGVDEDDEEEEVEGPQGRGGSLPAAMARSNACPRPNKNPRAKRAAEPGVRSNAPGASGSDSERAQGDNERARTEQVS